MEMSLYKLNIIKEKMEQENLTNSYNYSILCEKITNMELSLEDTSATGGPAVGGMGAVVNAQPSGLAGQTKNGEKKVMSFDDFKKDDVNTIKK
jgi:hypothetical protein